MNNELYHYGVKGMKWGVRRAAKKSTKSDSKVRAAYKEKRDASREWDRAYDRYTRTWIGKKRRQAASDRMDRANDRYQDAKANYKKVYDKTYNKMLAEAIKVDEVKTQYRKEYLAGQSAIGKAWSRLTDADKIYADMRYDLEQRGEWED